MLDRTQFSVERRVPAFTFVYQSPTTVTPFSSTPRRPMRAKYAIAAASDF